MLAFMLINKIASTLYAYFCNGYNHLLRSKKIRFWIHCHDTYRTETFGPLDIDNEENVHSWSGILLRKVFYHMHDNKRNSTTGAVQENANLQEQLGDHLHYRKLKYCPKKREVLKVIPLVALTLIVSDILIF